MPVSRPFVAQKRMWEAQQEQLASQAAGERAAATSTYASRRRARESANAAQSATAAVAPTRNMAPVAPVAVPGVTPSGQASTMLGAMQGTAETPTGAPVPWMAASERAAGDTRAPSWAAGQQIAADAVAPIGLQATASDQGRTMLGAMGGDTPNPMTPEEITAARNAATEKDLQGKIDSEWAAINERLGAGLDDSLSGMRANTAQQQRRAAEVNAMMGGGVGGGFGATMANLGAQGAMNEGTIRADYANKVVQTKMAYLDRLMADAQRAQDRSLQERISQMQADLAREQAELGYASDAASTQALADALGTVDAEDQRTAMDSLDLVTRDKEGR